MLFNSGEKLKMKKISKVEEEPTEDEGDGLGSDGEEKDSGFDEE